MLRSILRPVLTVLLYAGVVLFLAPYFTGHLNRGIPLLIAGAAGAVVAGLSRCFLTEGDCHDRGTVNHVP